jgi:hypothetical protein
MVSGTAIVTIPIGSWRGVARPQHGDLDVGRKEMTPMAAQRGGALKVTVSWLWRATGVFGLGGGGRSWGSFAKAVLGDSALDFAECYS